MRLAFFHCRPIVYVSYGLLNMSLIRNEDICRGDLEWMWISVKGVFF